MDSLADYKMWDGSQWRQVQAIGSDGDVATIYPMKYSADGATWEPQEQ